jgi:hypothetical protein
MSQTSKDEIDLGYLINKISELFKNISVSIYNSIQFCIRNWYFIGSLLIAGVVAGYFSEIDSKPAKKATLILRTNFDTADYAYNALNTLVVKSNTLDTVFLKQNGFKTDSVEIKSINIIPLANFKNITKGFEKNEKLLEEYLKNNLDNYKSLYFSYSDYDFHKVSFVMSNHASVTTLKKTLAYLNNNEIVNRTAQNGKQVLEANIAMNEFSIRQIDSTISKYNQNTFMGSASSQVVVVDKNFSYNGVLAEKAKLQKENTRLKQELVYADSAVIQVNNSNIEEQTRSIYTMKFVLYPLLFVFIFFVINLFSRAYKKAKAYSIIKNQ